jgi:hypothetical protein
MNIRRGNITLIYSNDCDSDSKHLIRYRINQGSGYGVTTDFGYKRLNYSVLKIFRAIEKKNKGILACLSNGLMEIGR